MSKSKRRIRSLLCILSLTLTAACVREGSPPPPRAETLKSPEEAAKGSDAPAWTAEPGLPSAAPEPSAAAERDSTHDRGAARRHAAADRALGDDPTSGLNAAMGREVRALEASGGATPSLRAPSRAVGKKEAANTLGASGIGVGGGGYGYGVGAMTKSAPLARMAPEQEFDREAYAHIAENDFHKVGDEPLSTFSVDVDTASYSNVRRFLREGRLPPADAVRIEELVNYFDYAYPRPENGEAFATYAELGACPWNPQHQLVHIGIAGKRIEETQVGARNLVFLIDVSGSMQSHDKLPLLKQGMKLLARNLRAEDHVSLVVYAGSSGLVLPSTRGSEQARILDALDRLEAGGSTNGAEGIQLAYREAQQHFIKGGINRVILATDGDFNVGVTSEGELTRLIEDKRKSGVFLTVLGFGTGNLQDSRMEQLADKGNGNYAYIDDLDEAQKVLVREAGATLVTIAKDVKLQVEFNPAQVESYRLVGYENRKLAARDFNDDKKDAGEIGAGHEVTALYEIVPRGSVAQPSREVDPLRYQGERPLAGASNGELLTVKVRYKAPDAEQSKLITKSLTASAREQSNSSMFRFAAAVAEFGMLLRNSPHKGSATLEHVRKLAESARAEDAHGERAQFLDMVKATERLGLGS